MEAVEAVLSFISPRGCDSNDTKTAHKPAVHGARVHHMFKVLSALGKSLTRSADCRLDIRCYPTYGSSWGLSNAPSSTKKRTGRRYWLIGPWQCSARTKSTHRCPLRSVILVKASAVFPLGLSANSQLSSLSRTGRLVRSRSVRRPLRWRQEICLRS